MISISCYLSRADSSTNELIAYCRTESIYFSSEFFTTESRRHREELSHKKHLKIPKAISEFEAILPSAIKESH